MMKTDFVYVFRKEHGDYMHIVREVQIKYPNLYEIADEPLLVVPPVEEAVVEEPVVVEEVKSVKLTKKK